MCIKKPCKLTKYVQDLTKSVIFNVNICSWTFLLNKACSQALPGCKKFFKTPNYPNLGASHQTSVLI
jgi:hypothetical protein